MAPCALLLSTTALISFIKSTFNVRLRFKQTFMMYVKLYKRQQKKNDSGDLVFLTRQILTETNKFTHNHKLGG
jgi:hypothetical protein